MKKLPLTMIVLVLTVWFGNAVAAPVRTIHDLPGQPTAVLKNELQSKLYAQLAREPVKAYFVVRGQIVGNTVTTGRVIRSDGTEFKTRRLSS